MKPGLILRSTFTVLSVLALILAPGSLVSCNGTTSESETGNKIDLKGRVLDKDRMPYQGVQARLAKTGLTDTTDALGLYFIRKDMALLKPGSNESLDTLNFLVDGKVVRYLKITQWVDSLVDVILFPPMITSPDHPYTRTVTPDDSVQFGIHYTGSPSPDIQWQIRTLNNAVWADISEATSDGFALESAAFTDSGKSFRAIACNALGCDTSHAAELRVVTTLDTIPPTIISPAEPYSRTVAVGDTVIFGIHATGSPIATYQWQIQASESGSWADLPSANLNYLALGPVVNSDDGKSFRAYACNRVACDTSHAAELRVRP